MCSMIVCVLVPRFALLAAVEGDRESLLRPVALAPEPGGTQAIGEVSGPAEAFGVRGGMALSEALARCPELVLVAPDADRTESAWEEVLGRLEGRGAAVESGGPGEAFFEADGMRALWGGHVEDVVRRTRGSLGVAARIGVAPTRFAAHAAAATARARAGRGRAAIVPEGTVRPFLAPLPVTLLQGISLHEPRDGGREAEHVAGMTHDLAAELERLGVRTLGELAALPSGAVADRFGKAGVRARRLAAGRDRGLRPRTPPEEVAESFELPEAASGEQLEHAMSLLIGRLLAHPARRGRSLRAVRVTARLAGGGGWRTEAVLRQASAEPECLGRALVPKLGELPGPATRLGLRALAMGSPGHDQPTLSRGAGERRRARLGEAVRQARAAAGREAVLRVLDVDPGSRVPERRAMLTPFPE
jgi:nucleotidyltransferase/DNA polymerase involved in DNA repair